MTTHMRMFACPACGGKLRIRSSRQLTPACREIFLDCMNHDCGSSFAGQMALTHVIAANRLGIAVDLPGSPARRNPANDPAAAPSRVAFQMPTPIVLTG